MANNQNEGPVEDKPKKYWNPGSYRYYMRYPKPTSRIKPAPIGLVNKQVKSFYLISTAFKIAKIVAIILIALLLIGRL